MKLRIYTTAIILLIFNTLISQDTTRDIKYIIDCSKNKFVQEDIGVGLNVGINKYSGEINGKIVDEKGEGVPFALVVVVEDSEGNIKTNKIAKADINGEYSLKGLSAGRYNLMYKALGYEKLIETRIQVSEAQRFNLNVTLEKGKIVCYQIINCCGGSRKKTKKAIYEEKENLVFYPNPCRGNLTVELPKNAYLIEIYDNKGHKIYTNDLKENNEKIQVDLNALSNGIYFINCLASGGKKYFEKLELNK